MARHKHPKTRERKNNRHKKHKHAERDIPKRVTGCIVISRAGKGYLAHPDLLADIEIPKEALNTALPGDEVEVAVWPRGKKGRLQGEVVRVIKRAREQYVGVVHRLGQMCEVVLDDARIRNTFSLPPEVCEKLAEGVKVRVRLERWDNPRQQPQAELNEVLGPAGEHETEMRAILAYHQFDYDFPSSVLREAAQLKTKEKEIFEQESANRRDFRGTPTFTIDPEDAKDFDDALSVRPLDGGKFEVGVHIADVSAYVRKGSAIDKEAAKRGTSVYLVDRTIPMLPPELSEDLCSLTPEADKLAFSVVFTIDSTGEVYDSWIGPTIIHSHKRFSYREAQEILDKGEGLLYRELSFFMKLARSLRQERLAHGGLEIETDEVKVELDTSGKPVRLYRAPHYETHHLIEELMLLANRTVAKTISDRLQGKPLKERVFVYRVHDEPPEEKIIRLEAFLRALGYDILKTDDGRVSVRSLNEVLRRAQGTPEADIVKLVTIRSMAKAMYALKNIGHYGLAFSFYTHFTSPIRRYPDLMVHRIVKGHLANKPPGANEFGEYERLALHASRQEIAAIEAERESVHLKQAEFLAEHIGKEFSGVVVGLTDWGIYVEERKTMAEGMVPLSSLRDDHYLLASGGFELVGRASGKRVRIGDIVRVKLTTVDIPRKEITFELIDKPPQAQSSTKTQR